MTVYTLNKSFKTSVKRTPRVMEIAEAFGIGLSDKEFTIFDQVPVEINHPEVVYITGQSGSGKSQALKLLSEQMHAEGKYVIDLNSIALDNSKPVIDQVGETTMQATELLAMAGISDAYIYLRKPSELSDGQRYRLKLAALMGSGADVWIADEFGAVLDRVTAKVVAFSMQKVARRLGKTLVVATTHDDMVEELAPDLIIRKRFKDRVDLERAA